MVKFLIIIVFTNVSFLSLAQTPTNLKIGTNLWQVIAQKSTFDEQHVSIDDYIKWFGERPDYLTRISRRASWYLQYIVSEVEKRNMPIELALLPAVESAFYPFSYSPQHASGLWQFIPSTGLNYGLTQDWWYDARRDIVASTKAALQYLSNLNVLFDGDWLLTIAAYNAGPGRVNQAISRNKRHNKATDFWSLDLPLETKSYVPKLLALLKIIKNPDKYQHQLVTIDNQPRITQISIYSQLDVRAISELSGLSIELIYELNPGLNRWATPAVEKYQLVLPIEVATDFAKKLSALPLSEQLEWVRHKLKKDEKLADVAKAYNLDVGQLVAINNLGGFDPRKNDFVIVPILKQHISFHALTENQRKQRLARQRNKAPLIYQVQSGDSLLGIALKFGVAVNDLVSLNDIDDVNLIKIGQTLHISQHHKINQAIAKAGINTRLNINRKILYQIKKGDSLSSLAKRFNVSVGDIIAWNKLTSDTIKYGENLILHINIVQ